MACENLTKIFKHYGLPMMSQQYAFAVIAVLVALLGSIGFAGNALTIVTLFRSKLLKTSVTNSLILSLCFSDLTSSLVSFIRLICFTWGYCDDFAMDRKRLKLMCQVGWRVTNWMTFNTVLHITAFSILRFVSVKWPEIYHWLNRRKISMLIVANWVISFLGGFLVVWFKPIRRQRILAYAILYLSFTLVMILSTLGTIAIILLQRKKRKKISMKGRRNEKRVADENQKILQLVLIVSSFVVGYVPRGAFSITVLETTPPNGDYGRWVFSVVQYVCLRISECLNPLFYNVASSKLRHATLSTLRWIKNGFHDDKMSGNSSAFTVRSRSKEVEQ